MKRKTKKRVNAEHGEENVQVKPHAYVHSNLSEGFWCGQNILSNIKKLKNSTNKKVKKLQVQKKKSKTEKKQKVYLYVEKYRKCTQKI